MVRRHLCLRLGGPRLNAKNFPKKFSNKSSALSREVIALLKIDTLDWGISET